MNEQKDSLLFIPDISGFTDFIEKTEVDHSQHVIAELLEILIEANTMDLQLAEIEGDALFFYKENMVPSQELLLAQIESMFSAFYSHLELLKKYRICPCNACAQAPNLQLKIIGHSGILEHIVVKGNRKPFGRRVIEAHRLLKNTINSDSYALITKKLAKSMDLSFYYFSRIFRFKEGVASFDGKEVDYIYSVIEPDKLTLRPISQPKPVHFDYPPRFTLSKHFSIAAQTLLEILSNYSYRHRWIPNAEKFIYAEKEVTRIGTEHICVVNGKNLDFIAITKKGLPGQLIYGELTQSPPSVDKHYQFYVITPVSEQSCNLEIEVYWEAKSIIKRLLITMFARKFFKSAATLALSSLHDYISNSNQKTAQ